MLSTTVGAFEAKTHLSALLERVERGEEIVITRHGHPVARLVPIARSAADAQAAVERLLQIGQDQALGLDWRASRGEGQR
ncbi:MAG: type II toxin-antitoxin system prevent-host-death family antitoxin [Methylibium sp.]|jgi:prevent-host-death family protein|uniref:type II toxin-antitoxin system Phd/YefM family antitoxin n=1 Tax=unclassified Methylibium TaxID=2633235 RepID=UPI0006FB41A0|nr:type II toxin-antitoxin system prevent-host-death family antitoxin [Methylibium sp. Root1272]KQW68642.1 prevent-host-death family protein [Methylibium sp. Root1272]MDP1790158.1 type II toxin-antitoxin system prevent-host-death family antitoxin [Methylibium sp.]